MKKKEQSDPWTETGRSHDYLFGLSQRGAANLQKLRKIQVRHHVKRQTEDKKWFHNYALLCSHFAVGDLCPNGKGCPDSHRLYDHFTYRATNTAPSGEDARKQIDKIFADAKK